jgi:hypothetical protein
MSWEMFTGVFVRGTYTEATGFGCRIPGEWAGLDYESARDATPEWFGVSSGNGNDGVSHHYPDYYVRTADPYRLAELAMVDSFKAGEGMAWAKAALFVDGERDYTISATILEDEDGCPAYGGGAWLIIEVFPADPEDVATWQADPYKRSSCYDSLESAFSAEALALVPAES